MNLILGDSLVSDLELGKAAEHLVCADLILKGFRAYLTDQGIPYDVVVDLNGKLIRIQVKATAGPRAIPQRKMFTPSYLWHVRRAGKKGRRRYGSADFDLLALVAVDIQKIAYLKVDEGVKTTVHLRPPHSPITSRNKILKNIDQYPFSEAINAFTR